MMSDFKKNSQNDSSKGLGNQVNLKTPSQGSQQSKTTQQSKKPKYEQQRPNDYLPSTLTPSIRSPVSKSLHPETSIQKRHSATSRSYVDESVRILPLEQIRASQSNSQYIRDLKQNAKNTKSCLWVAIGLTGVSMFSSDLMFYFPSTPLDASSNASIPEQKLEDFYIPIWKRWTEWQVSLCLQLLVLVLGLVILGAIWRIEERESHVHALFLRPPLHDRNVVDRFRILECGA